MASGEYIVGCDIDFQFNEPQRSSSVRGRGTNQSLQNMDSQKKKPNKKGKKPTASSEEQTGTNGSAIPKRRQKSPESQPTAGVKVKRRVKKQTSGGTPPSSTNKARNNHNQEDVPHNAKADDAKGVNTASRPSKHSKVQTSSSSQKPRPQQSTQSRTSAAKSAKNGHRKQPAATTTRKSNSQAGTPISEVHDKKNIWYTSSHEERRRVLEFWEQLSLTERSNLTQLDKEVVIDLLRQERGNCSCSVCNSGNETLEEEIDNLFQQNESLLNSFAESLRQNETVIFDSGLRPGPPSYAKESSDASSDSKPAGSPDLHSLFAEWKKSVGYQDSSAEPSEVFPLKEQDPNKTGGVAESATNQTDTKGEINGFSPDDKDINHLLDMLQGLKSLFKYPIPDSLRDIYSDVKSPMSSEDIGQLAQGIARHVLDKPEEDAPASIMKMLLTLGPFFHSIGIDSDDQHKIVHQIFASEMSARYPKLVQLLFTDFAHDIEENKGQTLLKLLEEMPANEQPAIHNETQARMEEYYQKVSGASSDSAFNLEVYVGDLSRQPQNDLKRLRDILGPDRFSVETDVPFVGKYDQVVMSGDEVFAFEGSESSADEGTELEEETTEYASAHNASSEDDEHSKEQQERFDPKNEILSEKLADNDGDEYSGEEEEEESVSLELELSKDDYKLASKRESHSINDFDEEEVDEDTLGDIEILRKEEAERNRRAASNLQYIYSRIFEQRLLKAYREHVTRQRQQMLLAELAEEEAKAEAEAQRKQKDKDKRKSKKLALKQQREEEAQRKALEAKRKAEKVEAARQKEAARRQQQLEQDRAKQEAHRRKIEERMAQLALANESKKGSDDQDPSSARSPNLQSDKGRQKAKPDKSSVQKVAAQSKTSRSEKSTANSRAGGTQAKAASDGDKRTQLPPSKSTSPSHSPPPSSSSASAAIAATKKSSTSTSSSSVTTMTTTATTTSAAAAAATSLARHEDDNELQNSTRSRPRVETSSQTRAIPSNQNVLPGAHAYNHANTNTHSMAPSGNEMGHLSDVTGLPSNLGGLSFPSKLPSRETTWGPPPGMALNSFGGGLRPANVAAFGPHLFPTNGPPPGMGGNLNPSDGRYVGGFPGNPASGGTALGSNNTYAPRASNNGVPISVGVQGVSRHPNQPQGTQPAPMGVTQQGLSYPSASSLWSHSKPPPRKGANWSRGLWVDDAQRTQDSAAPSNMASPSPSWFPSSSVGSTSGSRISDAAKSSYKEVKQLGVDGFVPSQVLYHAAQAKLGERFSQSQLHQACSQLPTFKCLRDDVGLITHIKL